MSTDTQEADAKSGIQVYLRIRPSNHPSSYIERDDVDVNKICFQIPRSEGAIINNSRSSYGFKFNGILDEKAKQKDVFKTIGMPVIKNALAGYNSTIFAYGQTGSGKTFTITGGPERYEDRGIIPRTISQLFKTIDGSSSDGTTYTCYVSYLEIYNQSGYDLLSDGAVSSIQDIPKVTMLEDEYGNFHFKNLSVHPVASEKEALNLLFKGDTNRAVAVTDMNANSTRSHCIFTMILECRRVGTDTVVRSKLNIVDLAGSERVSRTSSEGQTLKEAQYINSSLFFLEMVIIALHEKKNKGNDVHIPYRNSMMTSVLRDSLGGNCKTVMIAAISPEAQHTDESISTCHFAQRVALVKNAASINEEIEPEMVIQRLRAEVKRLRDEVAFLQGKGDDDRDGEDDRVTLPQHELNELTESVTKYVEDFDERAELDFCGGITLPKIKAVCSIFKKMLHSNGRVERRGVGSINDSDSDESSQAEADATKSFGGKSGRQRGHSMFQSKNKVEQRPPKAESKPKIRKVCGVPFCTDQQILDEPNAAFTWFKDRYPGISALEDTKSSLKSKYTEAKDGGKKIEAIRSRITYHKEAIERLRRNHAIDMISRVEGKPDDVLASQEKFHTDAINKEKNAYNETIDYLRKLKGTIEHQQTVVEKARTKMQSDFDLWYKEMCSQDLSPLPQKYQESEHRHVQAEKESPKAGPHTSTTSAPETLPVPKTSTAETKPEEPPEFVLPPGIKLTGNKEADDDIIAFFKAKQVLLNRTRK